MIDAADIDYASVMGWGFAPYTGGPLTLIDTMTPRVCPSM